MKVTDSTDTLDLEAFGKEAGERRSPGVHASDIWRDIELTTGKYSRRESEEDKRRGRTYQLGGFLWERVWGSALASLYAEAGDYQLQLGGEWTRDGIIGTPDLLDLQTRTVIDTKCCWRSSNKLEALEVNFWSWLVQLKCYCKMTGFTRGRLVVFFVNGNYAESGPQVKVIDLEFSPQEIEETWRMLVGHAKRRGWLPPAGGEERGNKKNHTRGDAKVARGPGRHARPGARGQAKGIHSRGK